MVPASFANFFLATAGAGGALIGLLFVAVSINPERTFGRQAHPLRQGVASGAFAALVNGFFISTWALLPLTNVGVVTLLVGAASVLNSGRFGAALVRNQWDRRSTTRVRWGGAVQVLGVVGLSLALYGIECYLAVLLLLHPHEMGLVWALGSVLLGVYALGLVRAGSWWAPLAASSWDSQSSGRAVVGRRGDGEMVRRGRGAVSRCERRFARPGSGSGPPVQGPRPHRARRRRRTQVSLLTGPNPDHLVSVADPSPDQVKHTSNRINPAHVDLNVHR